MKNRYLVLNVGGSEEGVEADYCLIPIESLPKILEKMNKVEAVAKMYDNEKSLRVVICDHVTMVKCTLMDMADEPTDKVPQGMGEFMSFFEADIEEHTVDTGLTYLEVSIDDFWYSSNDSLGTESMMVSRKELEEFIKTAN